MRIEATAKEIRALLQLVALDDQAERSGPDGGAAREAVERRVSRVLLERYRWLADGRRRPVVVAIERGACSGCHVRLPTMLEYQARRASALHGCPHCRRLLYAPELLTEGKKARPGAESPAARRRRDSKPAD